MTFDEFFADTPDGPPHPRLRDWKNRIDKGESATLEVYRSPTNVGLSQSRMFVHFSRDDKPLVTDETDWEQVLNEGLILLKVRAIDVQNESLRFALGLRDGLRTTEKEFGNGYFNAVLLDLIADSNLDQHPEIAAILQFTYHDPTDHNTPSYQRCREALALGIGVRAKELTKALNYSQETAISILTTALAKYLDERFSVSSRKQFGLLH
jgi:hypothetical protein